MSGRVSFPSGHRGFALFRLGATLPLQAYGRDVVTMPTVKIAFQNQLFDLCLGDPDFEEAHALAPTFPECAHTCC
jgi:hypothetical protein